MGGDTLVTHGNWEPCAQDYLLSPETPAISGGIVKWDVSPHGLPSGGFGTYSLRSGVAADLAAAGVGVADIRRFGGRVANRVPIYLFREDSTRRHAAQQMVKKIGLLEHLGRDLISTGEVRFSDNMINREKKVRIVGGEV